MDPDDASSIKCAQDMLNNPLLYSDLIFIKSNFEKLYLIIKRLEDASMPLKKSFELFERAKTLIKNTPGELGEEIQTKLKQVLKRNPDFKTIKKINKLLNLTSGTHIEVFNIPKENIIKYKYAPLTSCDVERSFSAYKMIFSEKRQNLTVENIEKILVIYCNINYKT